MFERDTTAAAETLAHDVGHVVPSVKNHAEASERRLVRSRKAPRIGKPGEPARPSAEDVLKAFNTWAFKREQPGDRPEMLRRIDRAVALGREIRFVLYWGKGPRHHPDLPEEACLAYLSSLVARIGAVYPVGATFTLVLTDTHARLNGHLEENITAYYEGVRRLAEEKGFSTVRLSDLVEHHDPRGVLCSSEEPAEEGLLRTLVTSAEKWCDAFETPEEGAKRYYQLNMRERRVLDRAFADDIFVTFNGSNMRDIFPEHMPIFYMYSVRRGTAVKPWFMTEIDQ